MTEWRIVRRGLRRHMASPSPALRRQIMVFIAIGCFTTGLYYAIAAALTLSGWMSLILAAGVGYGVGSLVNFGLQRWLTFEERTRHAVGGQFAVYWVVQGASLLLNMGIVGLLDDSLPFSDTINSALSVVFSSAIILVVNFAGHKWVTFNTAIWGSPEAET